MPTHCSSFADDVGLIFLSCIAETFSRLVSRLPRTLFTSCVLFFSLSCSHLCSTRHTLTHAYTHKHTHTLSLTCTHVLLSIILSLTHRLKRSAPRTPPPSPCLSLLLVSSALFPGLCTVCSLIMPLWSCPTCLEHCLPSSNWACSMLILKPKPWPVISLRILTACPLLRLKQRQNMASHHWRYSHMKTTKSIFHRIIIRGGHLITRQKAANQALSHIPDRRFQRAVCTSHESAASRSPDSTPEVTLRGGLLF